MNPKRYGWAIRMPTDEEMDAREAELDADARKQRANEIARPQRINPAPFPEMLPWMSRDACAQR
jgi:hypothetical protein